MEQASKLEFTSCGDPKASMGTAKPSVFGTPPIPLFQLGAVFALGMKKYGLFNWRKTRVNASAYYDAAQRHLMAWRDGENQDRESKHHPLAHVMACCAIIIDAETHGVLNDDRGEVRDMTSAYLTAHTKDDSE